MWSFIAIFIAIVCLLYWLRKRQMSILSRYGIPGPEPHLIFGNLFEGVEGKSMTDKQKFLIEKYGRVVGYYTGARPTVLIADPELAKMVEVKDFDYFIDRSIYLKYQHPTPIANGAIVKTCGLKWRQVRRILSPTFSSSKLKSMVPLVEESIQAFLEKVEIYAKTGQEFEIYDPYLKLAAQSLISTAFGLKTDLQNDTNNKFMTAAKKYFESKVNKLVFVIFSCFPQMGSFIQLLRGLVDTFGVHYCLTPIGVLYHMSSDIIKIRRENSSFRPKDLLQSMLDSELTQEEMSAMDDKSFIKNFGMTNRDQVVEDELKDGTETTDQLSIDRKSIRLTEDEIKANCIVFFGAGYETTSTALAYTTHFLVNYPEIQERIRGEVQELYEREGSLDYNTVNGLKYMDWVFNESMRMYPPLVTGSTRECLADYKYNDITIPKGASVAIATHYLHHDPEYWKDSEVFDPMRFSPERKHEIYPSTWQPFGDGPRNCIGMRFAYLLMKMTLAKLLIGYRMEKSANTEIGTLATNCKMVTMTPKNGVFIKVTKL